jgi:hypothetical protein
MSSTIPTAEEVAALRSHGPADDTVTVDLDESKEINVEVVDDRPLADQVEPRDSSRNDNSANDFDKEMSEAEIEALGQGATKRIKRLRYEFHEERRGREAAQRMSDEAVRFAQHEKGENERLRQLLSRGEEALLSEVRSRAEISLTSAKDRYRSALSEGDPDEVIKANEEMNNAQIISHQARNYEQVLPQQQELQQPAQVARPPQAQQAAPQQDPKLLKWVSENQWFNKDLEMTNLTLGIHKNLVEKHGMSPYSDEYYNRVDSRLREINPKFFGIDGDQGKEEPAARHVPSVVASASRSSGKGPRTVQLTSTAANLAERLGLTTEQYALQVLADEKKRKRNV